MMYDDRSYELLKNDYVHVDDIPTAQTKDFLEGIKEALYVSGDTISLEHCVEELCALYGVKFIDEDILLKSKKATDKYVKNIIKSESLNRDRLEKHLKEQREFIDRFIGRDNG